MGSKINKIDLLMLYNNTVNITTRVSKITFGSKGSTNLKCKEFQN
jgi:hypothetical protein